MKHKIFTIIFIVLLVTLWWFHYHSEYIWHFTATLALAYLIIVFYGSYEIRFNYFLRSVNSGSPTGIALTFDDGPDERSTKKIVEILALANTPATFFVIGKNAEKNPTLLKQIHDSGHTIGNHSYSHSNGIGLFSSAKLKSDIEHCSQVIQEITGVTPVYFRPPFGVTNPRYASVLKQLALTSVGWSLRSFDTSAKNEQNLLHRITSQLKPGSIVLLHDTKGVTVEILPALINYCKQNNLNIVPLPDLLKK